MSMDAHQRAEAWANLTLAEPSEIPTYE